MQISELGNMFEILKGRPPKKLVATWTTDHHSIEAIAESVLRGVTEATLVGKSSAIINTCENAGINPDMFRIIDSANPVSATEVAVDIINMGQGNLLMKGNLSTDRFMKAILSKEKGLVEYGETVSHLTVIKAPFYHKLLVISDVAIIPIPDLRQKLIILKRLARASQLLGIVNPKVALIAATEQISLSMPACTEAAIITRMAERGQIPGAVVDGPLSLDLAVDPQSVRVKEVKSDVAGDADCLLFPNIESGNVFYKTVARCGNSEQAAILTGARVPVVLSSRGDSKATKLNSIALAVLFSS